MNAITPPPAPPDLLTRPRQLNPVNWRGLWTLSLREVRRFLKLYFQTVIAPVVTALLFLAVFSLSVGRTGLVVQGIPFTRFLAPGLIMMAITQNAFANTTSSLMVLKMQGNIVDLLMSPLSPLELAFGFVLGGVMRGLIVGLCVTLAVSPFVPIAMAAPLVALYYAMAASLFMSLLGIATAIWADKFDHVAVITNFVIMPLAFLSGTFYSIERLPPILHNIAFIDPLFYLIDGFRAGFIGHSDGPLALGMIVVATADLLLAILVYWIFRSGYKLKS